MAGFQVVTLTKVAEDRIHDIIANANKAATDTADGIRVGVKNGGCAGMEYTVDLVTEPNPADDMVESNGAKVYVAPEAVLFLLGTELDYEVTKLRSGFVFNNPNQSSACGCGESVTLVAAELPPEMQKH